MPAFVRRYLPTVTEDGIMTPLWLKVGIEIPEQILTIGYTSYSYYFLLFFFARIEEEKMK